MGALFDSTGVELPDGVGAAASAPTRWLLGRLASDPAMQLQKPEVGLRWTAYMMATVEHETWRTFAPREEVGYGQGHFYGAALRTVCADGTVRENIYYGRGYVQLTWQANYARLGVALGLGRALVEQPEMALQPDIAYRILSYGMTQGTFTGVGLARFINSARVDYFGARRIINGEDCAEKIAALAGSWEERLCGSRAIQPTA